MIFTKENSPLCPKCGTQMTPRDDKFDCHKCKSFYYQDSWLIKLREKSVGKD